MWDFKKQNLLDLCIVFLLGMALAFLVLLFMKGDILEGRTSNPNSSTTYNDSLQNDSLSQIVPTIDDLEIFDNLYSKIGSIVNILAAQAGGNLEGKCAPKDDICLMSMFLPYLKYKKVCYPSSKTHCWNFEFTRLNNKSDRFNDKNGASIDFLDGSSILFHSWSPGEYLNGVALIGDVHIDTNGPSNGPNKLGVDIFNIHILSNKALAFGISGDGYENTCNINDTGMGCANFYLNPSHRVNLLSKSPQ